MNRRRMMGLYLKKLERSKLLTRFIALLFDYKDFHDYNYIYRMVEENMRIIIDIYDNISTNRFNRYIISFKEYDKGYNIQEMNNVFVTYINVFKIENPDNMLLKFCYLFTLELDKMVEYAKGFLDLDMVLCLDDMLRNAKM